MQHLSLQRLSLWLFFLNASRRVPVYKWGSGGVGRVVPAFATVRNRSQPFPMSRPCRWGRLRTCDLYDSCAFFLVHCAPA